MITATQDEYGQYHVRGLSTDDKPIGTYPGNSVFEEMDTGDKFYYDELAGEWAAKGA